MLDRLTSARVALGIEPPVCNTWFRHSISNNPGAKVTCAVQGRRE